MKLTDFYIYSLGAAEFMHAVTGSFWASMVGAVLVHPLLLAMKVYERFGGER